MTGTNGSGHDGCTPGWVTVVELLLILLVALMLSGHIARLDNRFEKLLKDNPTLVR